MTTKFSESIIMLRLSKTKIAKEEIYGAKKILKLLRMNMEIKIRIRIKN